MTNKRTMNPTRLLVSTLALGLLVAPVANAFLNGDGKGKPERDCYIGLDGYSQEDLTAISKNGKKMGIACTDGDACDTDGTVNDVCTFNFAVCANNSGVDGCDPATRTPKKIVAKAKSKAGKIDLGTSFPGDLSSACSAFVDFPVGVKVKKNGSKKALKGKVTLIAKKPTDKDKFTFVCNPSTGSTTTTTMPIGGPKCGKNPANLPPLTPEGDPQTAPDQLTLTVGQTGTDLDNGWTGISHNFPVTPSGSVTICLDGCTGSEADSVCTGTGPVGPDTVNGPVFGAPLPLLAANVPVCVVNRFAQPVTGSSDLVTGETDLSVILKSDVYFTSSSEVCPRCNNNNRCSSGANVNKPCTLDATLEVVQANGNTTYNLSEDCPPAGNPDGILDIDLPLTSGTTAPLVGPKPCSGSGGIPDEPNDCGGSACDQICTGNACVAMVDDPANPGSMVCVDDKGGLSQLCCGNDTTKPCFPLENGGELTRTGRAEPPTPPLPDTTYPKAGTGVLGAVFCEASTSVTTIDRTTGLPGPAALLLNGTYSWSQVE